jgi:hypothetical protein
MGVVLKILAVIGELLIKWGIRKKQVSDGQRADALEKTVESVNESLEVEETIREKQQEVEDNPSRIDDGSGGIEFSNWNKGK